MKNKFFIILILFFVSCMAANRASAGTATVSWNANTETDLAGYKIYYGTSPRSGACPTGGYPSVQNVGKVTSYTFNNLTDNATYYFSVTAYDTSNNESTCSSEVTKAIPPPPDITPPTISSVSASSISANSATINWTTNEASNSQVEYGLTASYGSQTTLNTSLVTSHSQTLSGLSSNTTYHYRVKSSDAAGNQAISIDYTFITIGAPDTTAPAAVSNLSATNITGTSLYLIWTAPGDDGNSGIASNYDIRYSTSTITDANWVSANQLSGEPAPKAAGIAESFTVSYTVVGLLPSTTYYFAIKTSDEVPNVSALSNVSSATTQSPTISVSLSASPNSGTGFLSGVDLTATVSGTATGNINYTFYCNRSDSGTNITSPYDAKYDSVSQATKTATGVCTYSSSGNYTAKVVIERGALQAENRTNIAVYPAATPPTTAPSVGGGGGGGGGSIDDTTPPAQASNSQATAADRQIALTWKNPIDADFVRVIVIRKEGSVPTSRTDGVIVYEGANESYTDINLDNSKTYYYTIYAYDRKPNYSNPVTIFSQPVAGKTTIGIPAPSTGTSGGGAACTSLPYANESLLRETASPKVYIVQDCKRRWIPTAEVFNANGYQWKNIAVVTDTVLNQYPEGDSLTLIIPTVHKNALLYKLSGSPKVFAIVNGQRHWIPNPTVFSLYSYTWANVKVVSSATLNKYFDVRLLKGVGDPKVYYFNAKGQKKWIINPEVFNSYNNKWTDILEVLPSEIETYPVVVLVGTANDPKVFLLEGTTKHWIKTQEAFQQRGYKWADIDTINQTEMNAYQEGSVIE